jgi:hypothetical protein
MSTTTQDTAKDAASAVNEAVRATAEATRRNMQSSQEAARLSRDIFEGSTDASRKLFLAYTSVITTGMKAVFDVQNAALASQAQVLDVANTSYRGLVTQVNETMHQTQAVTLDAWQAGIRASEKLASNPDKA